MSGHGSGYGEDVGRGRAGWVVVEVWLSKREPMGDERYG